jgi:general secretion pathway protein E
LILGRTTEREITDAARGTGMTSMYEDGLSKVWHGETTIDEVLHATRVI